MRALEVCYRTSEPGPPPGHGPPPDPPVLRPVGSVVSPLRFQIYDCLADFAGRVAGCRPELQGTEQPVEVEWAPSQGVLFPAITGFSANR